MRRLAALTLLMTVQAACRRETPAPESVTHDRPATTTPSIAARPAKAERVGAQQRLSLTVTDEGFVPSPAQVEAGVPLHLTVTRTSDQTCATELVLPEHGINVPLPLNKAVDITFTPAKAGFLTYGCAMDRMVSGVLQVN